MAIFDNGGQFLAIDGNIVERTSLEIVEAIKQINPNLDVLCLDPDHVTGLGDFPFIIAEMGPDGVHRQVFGCMELNSSVLDRIKMADSERFDIQKIIDDENAKVRKEQEKAYREKMDDAKELSTAIVNDTKSRYSFTREDDGAKVTIYDDRPAKVEPLKD